MSEHEFLGFNILTMKVILMWPPNGQMSSMYKMKSGALLLVVYLTAYVCFNGILRTIFIESDGLDALIQRITGCIDFAGCVYMRYCFLRRIEDVNSLIEQLHEFEKYCPKRKILTTDERVRHYSKAMMVYWFCGNLMNCLASLLDRNECNQNRKSDLYRERDPCGLLARCFFPFDVSKTLFPLAYFMQVYSCAIVTYYIVVLTMILVGILMHTLTQLRFCRGLIRNLGKRIDEGKNINLRGEVQNIIQYHIRIIRYSEKTNEAFSTMMMLHLTLPSLVISALGFEILIVDNFNDSLRFTLHLFGWLLLLLLVCYYGQILIDESIAVAEDIYFMPWHEAPVDVQKDIYMILMRSEKPLNLSAANIGIMSFPTFLRVISSAYSYFTLLLNVRS